MKTKYTFEIMEIDDQQMAVPIGENADQLHGILKLNQTAAAILELLKEERTEEEIVQQLLESYEASEEELRGYVHDYLGELEKAGIIEA